MQVLGNVGRSFDSRVSALRNFYKRDRYRIGPRAQRTQLLIALSKRSGSKEEVVAMVGYMVDERLASHQKHFALAMVNLGRHKLWREAAALLAVMRERLVRPNTRNYNVALNACARGGAWRLAVALAGEMEREGTKADVVTHTSVVSACARATAWEQALRAFGGLLASGVRVDRPSVVVALGACAEGGRWQEAIAVVRDAQARGLKPDEVTWNCLISACGRGRQWEHACSILDRLPTLRVQPSMVSHNSLVSACASAAAWQQALLHFSGVLHSGRADSHGLGAALQACAPEGRWQRAMLLLRESLQRSLDPGFVGWGVVLNTLTRGGEWQRALSLLHWRSRIAKVGDGSYNIVIGACSMNSKWELGLGLFDQMGTAGIRPTAMSYNAAISACGYIPAEQASLTGGRRAEVLLTEMRAAGLTPDELTYAAAVRAVCSDPARDWAMILDLLERAQAAKLSTREMYFPAVEALQRASLASLAMQLHKEFSVAHRPSPPPGRPT